MKFEAEIVGRYQVVEGVHKITVYGESCIIDYDEDRISVFARINHDSPDLDDYPVMWAREHGRTVWYSSLGNTRRLEHGGYGRILLNGVECVAGN